MRTMIALLLSVLLISATTCAKKEMLYDTAELQSRVMKVEQRGGIRPAIAKKDTIHWLGTWKNEGSREELIQNVRQEFQFLNQEVYVNLVFPEDLPEFQQFGHDWSDALARDIGESLSNGREVKWDIIQSSILSRMDKVILNQTFNRNAWIRQHFIDFETIDGFKQSHKPFVFNRESPLGMHVGPYTEGSYNLLFYNSKIAEKIGLNIEPHEMTFQNLITCIEQIKQYNLENNTNIQGIGALFYNKYWTQFYAMLMRLCLSEVEFAQKLFDQPHRDALKKTLAAFETLINMGGIDSRMEERSPDEVRQAFLDGEIVFFLEGSWAYNHLQNVDGEKVKDIYPCEMPVFKTTKWYDGGYKPVFAVIDKKSEKTKKACELLSFWSSKDIAEDWILATKCPTGIIGHFQGQSVGGDQYETFFSQIESKYGKNIKNPIFEDVFGDWQVGGAIVVGEFFNMLHQEISADELYQKILTAFNEDMDSGKIS